MPFNLLEPHQGQGQPRLPSFEEVLLTYEYEDSIRLPSYQGRTLARYHPYRRYLPHRSEESAFMNTIYDEEGIFLEAVPQLNARNAPVAGPEADALLIPPHPSRPTPVVEPEQAGLGLQVRTNHFGSNVMMAFLQGVRRAIAAEAGDAVTPSPTEPEVRPEAETAIESEPEHTTASATPSLQVKL